uniref:FBA_2 domain-containing protein n=1 Tax=Caenorhabditis tropicalis TaxID=1561998 RepID=A0A1I7UDQ4_9PELO
MTSELTYPSLRCIWEYMEPNKRIHITSRSPQLQRIDKSIPLHIDYLRLAEGIIQINDVEYETCYGNILVTPDDERYKDMSEKLKLTPGDIQGEPRIDWQIEGTHLGFRNGPNYFERWHTEKPYVISKRQACLLFEGRSQIIANLLHTTDQPHEILRLPVGFKVHTSVIRCEFQDFPYILPIVKSSFILNEIETSVRYEDTLDHLQLRNAKRLIINRIEVDEYMDQLETLTNKYVGFKDCYLEADEIVRVVRHWVRHGKPYGTVWEIGFPVEDYLSLLEDLKKEFNGKLAPFDKPVDKRIIPAPGYLVIPLDLKYELIVYGINWKIQGEKMSYVRIESVPIQLDVSEVVEIKSVPSVVSFMTIVRKVLDLWNWMRF